jgi:hypothetical protein
VRSMSAISALMAAIRWGSDCCSLVSNMRSILLRIQLIRKRFQPHAKAL